MTVGDLKLLKDKQEMAFGVTALITLLLSLLHKMTKSADVRVARAVAATLMLKAALKMSEIDGRIRERAGDEEIQILE